jgi:hypothetical protein
LLSSGHISRADGAEDIANMPSEDYRKWLEKLNAAKRLAAQLDDLGPWYEVSKSNAKEKALFTFIRLEGLP